MRLFKVKLFSKGRIIVAVILILSILAVLLLPSRDGDFFTDEAEYSPIDITILHVETFEGGKNTRSDILSVCGELLQEEYPDATFTVVRTTLENLEANIWSVQPDMISFGFGAGEICEKYLVEYSGELKMKDVFVSSGVSENGEMLAVAWSFGMYYFFQGGAPINYGTENACSTLLAAYFDLDRLVLEDYTEVSKIDGYASFVSGGSLIGTQRDVVRAMSGNISHSYNLERLENYTDLVQYVGITVFFEARMNAIGAETANLTATETSAESEQNQSGHENIPTAFIELLTSENMASYFEKYYMFNILEIPIYGSLEGFSQTDIQIVPNVFEKTEELKENQQLAYAALVGDEEAGGVLDVRYLGS